MMDVASTQGFYPGARIAIVAGKSVGEKLVVTKIVSSTVMSVRKYNIFDQAHDWILQKWHELQERFWTWYEVRFGKTEVPYDENLE